MLWIILTAILIFLAVLLVRAAAFRPQMEEAANPAPDEAAVDSAWKKQRCAAEEGIENALL